MYPDEVHRPGKRGYSVGQAQLKIRAPPPGLVHDGRVVHLSASQEPPRNQLRAVVMGVGLCRHVSRSFRVRGGGGCALSDMFGRVEGALANATDAASARTNAQWRIGRTCYSLPTTAQGGPHGCRRSRLAGRKLQRQKRTHSAPRAMNRKRVVVAGLGDVGVLTAIRLARHADVVGISVKPALASGQELGWRLSRPDDWARANWIPFDRFRGLDRVRTVHGTLTGVDLASRTVSVRHDDGSTSVEGYDALVISTGVTNGFWRQPNLESASEIGADLRSAHDHLAAARSVIVVGGGAAAVSSAANLARTWPDKRVELYFPGQRLLMAHHPRIWGRVRRRLTEVGVGLHAGHRAVLPDGFAGDQITT